MMNLRLNLLQVNFRNAFVAGVLFAAVLPATVAAQGISFSYLLPKNGYLSAPVSPFSVRGLGYYYGPVGVETGGSLYLMPGLAMEGLPFTTNAPLTGPHFSLLVPLELALRLNTKIVTWKIKGGGAGVWHINPRLNMGNFDRALRDYEGWQLVNADADISSRPGIGWVAGTAFEWHVASSFSISTEFSYLKVSNKATLTGVYTGAGPAAPETKSMDFPDAFINTEGFEISIGVTLKR